MRSALLPNYCIVHEKYLEQQQGTKRRGRPRDDCLACQAGLSSSLCDQKGVVYWLECIVCNEECIGESQQAIRRGIGEHHANQCTEPTARDTLG